MPARAAADEPVEQLQLLEKNGAIRLPAEVKAVRAFGTKHDNDVVRVHELMRRGHNMLHCRRRDNSRASPEEVANAAGHNRETFLGLFHYPGSDAMLDRMAAGGDVASMREAAADREALAQAACDEIDDGPPANTDEPQKR